MKKGEIKVEIKTCLTVSDEMAARCLALLEMWQEDNPEKYIEGKEIITDTGRKIIYKICMRQQAEPSGGLGNSPN